MKISNFLYATAAVTMTSGLAFAVTQGSTGATSTGTITVSMDILEEVKISNLADISLGTFVPDGTDEVSNDAFCIYYGNAINIDLTLTSTNGGAGVYSLDDGGGVNLITYTVEVDNDPTTGTGGITYVAHAEGATVQYGIAASANNDDCTIAADHADIRITVADAGAVLGVPNGTYSDTITLLVAPNP